MVEHMVCNHGVEGSSPFASTTCEDLIPSPGATHPPAHITALPPNDAVKAFAHSSAEQGLASFWRPTFFENKVDRESNHNECNLAIEHKWLSY